MDNTGENNIRQVSQLLGDKGVIAQGADNELLVSLKFAELGMVLPLSISVLPSIAVSSLPSLVVSTMPSLTVSSMPSLTANPTRPTILAQVLLTNSDATLYTAAANWRDVVIYVKNVDTVARTCQVALGATATDTLSLVKNLPLEVGARIPIFVPALASAQVLRGLCDSTDKVSVEIWGTSA